MRRLRVLLVAPLVGGLVACGPQAEPILGLSVGADGQPVVVLFACTAASRLSMYPAGGAAADPDFQWSTSTSTSTAATVTELAVFAPPPPGWEGGPAAGRLKPSVRYTIAGDNSNPAQRLTFTTDDLPRIGAGQVLVPDGDTTRVVTRPVFESRARRSCS